MDTFCNHLETVRISSTRPRTTTAEDGSAPPNSHYLANHFFVRLVEMV